MDIVLSGEKIAQERRMKSESILLLDLGSILMKGSSRTLEPLLSLQSKSQWSSLLAPEIHMELRLVLAVPLEIIVVVSQGVYSKSIKFLRSDFVQDIRHEFLFLRVTRNTGQDPGSASLLGISVSPMVAWSDGQMPRWFCHGADRV